MDSHHHHHHHDHHQPFDNVLFEKHKALARFNRFRKLRQAFELLLLFAFVSWSSSRAPHAINIFSESFLMFSSYLLNHHVVFLIGNAIIVILCILCRRNLAANLPADDGDGGGFYDEYVKHSETTASAAVSPPPEEEEKQIVEEEKEKVGQCDDVAVAIEEAEKQIRKFQRTQSEKLKREIAVERPNPPELRRSETENCRRREMAPPLDIEMLSNEEFQRTVDAFINKHWVRREPRQERFEFQNLQMVKTTS